MLKKIIVLAAAATAVLGSTLGASADRYNRQVRIVNDTGVEMREFYASSVGQRTWQEDILGRYTLPAGNSVNINIDDGTGYCMYDFKAVFADGDVVIKNRINVCEIGSFRYY